MPPLQVKRRSEVGRSFRITCHLPTALRRLRALSFAFGSRKVLQRDNSAAPNAAARVRSRTRSNRQATFR